MGIEILHAAARTARPTCALFDLDGTLSLVRAGWAEHMLKVMVGAMQDGGIGGPVEELRAWAMGFILRTTGKPSLVQMGLLGDEIVRQGGHAAPAERLEAEFQGRLMEVIGARRQRLAECRDAGDGMLVPGARSMLESLQARGVRMYLASGTLHDAVVEEVRLLGLDGFFDGRVCGSGGAGDASPKQRMVGRMVEDGFGGPAVISFGDGWVETELVKGIGGTAVGVASDERGRSGLADPHKRSMLIEAGADVVIPDYAQRDEILSLFWPN